MRYLVNRSERAIVAASDIDGNYQRRQLFQSDNQYDLKMPVVFNKKREEDGGNKEVPDVIE